MTEPDHTHEPGAGPDPQPAAPPFSSEMPTSPPPLPPPPPRPPASAPAGTPPPPPSSPVSPPRAIGELGRAAQIAVGVSALLGLGLAWAQWDRRGVITDFRDNPGRVSFDDLVGADDRVALFALVYVVSVLVSGIIFLVWFHRAYVNLVDRGLAKHRRGWAVGSWFVPFLNFWRPAKMTQELLDDGRGEGTNPPGVMWTWWVLWLAGFFLDRASNGINSSDTFADTVDDAITADLIGALGGVAWAGAGALLFVLIGQICARAAHRQEASA